MNKSRLTSQFLLSVLSISPAVCFAQTGFSERRAAGPRGEFVVSVQELKMSGKSRKAFEKGAELLNKGNAEASLAYFERAIADYPEHYKAYYNLGIAHYRLGHTAEAEQAFQKSIDLTGGGYAPPHFGMGMVLCQEHELQKAEMVLQRGLDLDPGSATGKYFLGFAQFGLNRLVDAERSVQQALLRKANFAEAYFLLARIHLRQYNRPGVEQDLKNYLQLEPRGEGSQQARALLALAQQATRLQENWTLTGTLVP